MTDLERRALLGDQEAQRECTEKRIVLSCPYCGCEERDMIGLSVSHDQYYYSCEACGCNGPIVFDNDSCDYPEHDALAAWNARPAPPIGRCKDCLHYFQMECLKIYDDGNASKDARQKRKPDDFCSYFEPCSAVLIENTTYKWRGIQEAQDDE